MTFGSYTTTITLNTGVTAGSYVIPLTWCTAIPSATSGICTMKVYTYQSGTLIGTRNYAVTIQVPASVVPSIGNIVGTETNANVPAGWGGYVQNISGISITVSGCQGVYGSTITKYTISGGMSETQVTNASSVTFVLPQITASGSVAFSVTVTDSRGRTTTGTLTILVYSYSAPAISSVSAVRCVSDGTIQSDGTYISAEITSTYSVCGNHNAISMSVSYRENGTSAWTYGGTLSQATPLIIGGGNIAGDKSYDVQFTVVDEFNTVTRIVVVGVAFYTLHFRNGGTGVGIGTVCQTDKTFIVNGEWAMYHGSNPIPDIVYSSAQPSTATQGMIWLKPVT